MFYERWNLFEQRVRIQYNLNDTAIKILYVPFYVFVSYYF